MGLKDFFRRIKREQKVVKGETVKNKTYSSKKEFSSREIAEMEFRKSVEKLFNVNAWTKMPGISSTFQLYDPLGQKKQKNKPQVKDFIRIKLPGSVPENWVVVTNIREVGKMASFTVSPSENPVQKGKAHKETEHFFIDGATSTFKVELQDKTLYAYEIGRNEGINNQEEKEAGNRKFINTLLAEGGWAGFQKFQWKKLTNYLVHKIEIEDN